VLIGCSDTQLYKVTGQAQTLYLKTQSILSQYSFEHEVNILNWLGGKLPVPLVVAFSRDSENEYLILSEVAGINCVEAMETMTAERVVQLLAEGLRQIHALDIRDCPFDERIDGKLKRGQDNVLNNLVEEEMFDQNRQGMTAGQVLELLQQDRPTENDLVFNHGDYCLPNVIIQNDQVSGFVDLGRAGVSDRYNDLAIASRSIKYNLGPEFEPLFFEYYGFETIDPEKIAYYRMMDELF